ncbi:MAG: hypothetical protein ABJG88_00590, partial [Litorimonas sp.]
PVYFPATITQGDADIGKGNFEIGCTPGSQVTIENVSKTDLAYAYLNSQDLPIESRHSNFGWMIRFALMYDYVENTSNATFAGDREACVRMNTEFKEKHAVTDRHRKIADHFLGTCHEADYNYLRKRQGIPEITQ